MSRPLSCLYCASDSGAPCGRPGSAGSAPLGQHDIGLQHFVIALFFEPYLDVVELDSDCAVAPDQGCARESRSGSRAAGCGWPGGARLQR